MDFFVKYKFILSLTSTIIIFGSFGGVINYLLNYKSGGKSKSKAEKHLIKSIVLGIGAAFLVPLFLNLLSSDIMDIKESGHEELMVFAGVCLIAAISSSKFISALSGILLKKAEDIEGSVSAGTNKADMANKSVAYMNTENTGVKPEEQGASGATVAIAQNNTVST